jgi:integrase/recombinase XerD
MSDVVVVDPEGLTRRLEQYVQSMRTGYFSETTIKARLHHLNRLIGWAADRGITRPGEITKPVLERYQRWLFHYRKKSGAALSLGSQHEHLLSVKMFFRWLARGNYVLYNPAADLAMPRRINGLPKEILSQQEIERVINQTDAQTPLGLRDRAILETLYSTGMRRMELIGLQVYDVDHDRGTVLIRRGKGGKIRMVPIGERALRWVERYLHEVRQRFAVEPDDGTLFLTHEGRAIAPLTLSETVRQYLDAAGIKKRGAAHLFRHAMATLMLEGGADIRYIQAMLGHASLDTTQLYTQVSIAKLKEIHTAAHPAKMEPTKAREAIEEAKG